MSGQRHGTGLRVAYLPSEDVVERAQDVVRSTESHVLVEGVRPLESGISVLLLKAAEKELGKIGSRPRLQIRSE